MSNIYNATNTFSNTWSKADKKISDELDGKKKIPFFIEEIGGEIDQALKQVEIRDVVQYTKTRWRSKSGVPVNQWLPDKFQGFHGAALEKVLRKRYKEEFAKDVAKIYSNSAKSWDAFSNQEKIIKDLIKIN